MRGSWYAFAAFLFVTLVPFAEAKKVVWTYKSGETLKAELLNLYGGLVHFKDGRTTMVRPGSDFTREDQVRIKAWKDAQPERPLMADSDARLTKYLRDRLVSAGEDGEFVDVETNNHVEPEFYALYFSAKWCGPCRRFTPRLVSAYNGLRGMGSDHFELIFVSNDRSDNEMAEYMQEEKMPWPAIRYKDRNNWRVDQHSGRGIPCLAIVDTDGNLIWHTYMGGKYDIDRSLSFLKQLAFITKEAESAEEAEKGAELSAR